MKTASICATVLLALCFAAAPTGAAEEAGKKILSDQNRNESKIVYLDAAAGIYPEALTVKPGTTVIWVNNSRSDLQMKFLEKQVTLACKSPVHFIVDGQGYFVSDLIPPDSVASLCFVEKGVFDYELSKKGFDGALSSRRQTVEHFRGKIIVE